MNSSIPSERLRTVEEYYFSTKLQEIAAMKEKGEDIINLGIGSPDLPPSKKVVESLSKHANLDGSHQYQSYKGVPRLRQAFSDWYKKSYHVNLDPSSEILPLIGSKEGIMHISMAFISEGDEVLVPNPGYPSYEAAAKLAGGTVRKYVIKEDNQWLPDFNALEEAGMEKVKLMWINYPHMPTGANLLKGQLEEFVLFARKHEIILVNDNPYSFILNEHPESLLSYSSDNDLVIELNSLSKSHNMAGWRVGMVGGNAELIKHILSFKSNMDSGMFLPVQQAAITALELDQDWYTSLNKTYELRRNFAWEFMDAIDCSYRTDAAGLFVWAEIPDDCSNGKELADELLYEHGIFITPGFIFGSEGMDFVRVSLCTPNPVWEKAMDRLESKNKAHLI